MIIVVPILCFLAAIPLFFIYLIIAAVAWQVSREVDLIGQAVIGLIPASLVFSFNIFEVIREPLCWPNFDMELTQVPCSVPEAFGQIIFSVFLIQVIPLAISGAVAAVLAFFTVGLAKKN